MVFLTTVQSVVMLSVDVLIRFCVTYRNSFVQLALNVATQIQYGTPASVD